MNRADAGKPDPRSLSVGALLTALVALGQISTSIYIPSMPSLVGALAASPPAVNLTFSLFLLGFALSQIIFGPLSDRYGRRPVLFAGIGLYLLATVLCALATTIEALIVGRFLQGMAAASGPVLGRAMVRDIYGPEETARAMAYIGAALAISPALAPIFGGYLQVCCGWRAAFVVLGAVGVLILVLAFRVLGETNTAPDPRALEVRAIARAFGTLLRDRRYCGYTLAVSFVFAGLMVYTGIGPFVFIDFLGLSPEHYGMLALVTVTGFLIGSLIAGRMTARFGLDRLLVAGAVICLVGGGGMAALAVVGSRDVFAGVLVLVLPMTVFTLGMGLVLANGMAGAMAPFPRIAGAASALMGFVQMVVAGAVVVLVGLLPQTSARPMAFGIAATGLCTLLALTTLRPRRKPSRP
jgi:DHA1 family bicyclomycin/chloramphenicol resistance-like MFS transporter